MVFKATCSICDEYTVIVSTYLGQLVCQIDRDKLLKSNPNLKEVSNK